MAALYNRAGHYIFVLWFLLSFFFFSSPILSRQKLDVYHTSIWCGVNANLEFRSEMCCMRLAESTGRKKLPKICHLGTIAQLCRSVSSQLRHVSIVGKNLVKQQHLVHMSSQYGELRPTSGWDRFTSLGHPSKFQRISRVGFVTAPTSLNGCQPNFARCLAASWAGTLYIHIFRAT